MSDEQVKSFVYFGSSSAGTTHLLSNLNFAPITLSKDEDGVDALYLLNPDLARWLETESKPIAFHTIEHLWHALKATEKDTFLQFAENGRFAQFNSEIFRVFFGRDAAESKFKYWDRKDNWGIIPKLVSNAKYCSRLMLNGKMNYAREMPEDVSVLVAVWSFLLRKKYDTNKAHRDALLRTGSGTTLVEMSRLAAVRPDREFWGGYSKDGRHLCGRNFMGEMMQRRRSALLAENKKEK